MRIVASLKRSAGNESVGDMWVETKVFDDTESLETVFKWAYERTNSVQYTPNVNVTLSVCQ